MKRSVVFLFASVALASVTFSAPTEDDKKWVQEQNIPPQVKKLFKDQKLDAKYEFIYDLNPFYLRGDFNGDGKADIAVRIKETKSGKVGIAICHAGKNDVVVFGAGTDFGNGGDDLAYLDVWVVYPERKVGQGAGDEKPPVLTGEALYVEKTESSSALIYWTGKGYKWYQQGD